MKTFKVTYFDREMDIESVITYHNVVDQSRLLENIAINIYTLNLHEAVKCEADGHSYTQVINELLIPILQQLRA